MQLRVDKYIVAVAIISQTLINIAPILAMEIKREGGEAYQTAIYFRFLIVVNLLGLS